MSYQNVQFVELPQKIILKKLRCSLFYGNAKVCLALPMTRTQETFAETKAKLVVGSTTPARNGLVRSEASALRWEDAPALHGHSRVGPLLSKKHQMNFPIVPANSFWVLGSKNA